uniref:Uncharacterized protein n=1 Tax=Esox lucius TaxID=8010 RepID=A0A6Q2ZI35_ESOLU
MGNKKSTPPPPKEFDQEWRKTDWSKQKRKAMVDELKNLNLDKSEVGLLRCLLIGPVGAGKSSFIDSVNNIFQGRITQSALVASNSQKSFTKTVSCFKFVVWCYSSQNITFDKTWSPGIVLLIFVYFCLNYFFLQYKTHYIRNGANHLPFAINDIMGLENEDECGIHPDDIMKALQGHLNEG